MKRFLAPALILGVSTFGLVGCEGETAKNETKVEQTTPGGTTTETKVDKVEKSGDNPPPATTEKPAEPAAPAATPEAAAPK